METSPPSLLKAFGLDTLGRPPQIALTGSGGKTTLMFALANVLAAAGVQTWLTTSTHLGIDQIPVEAHVILENQADLDWLPRQLPGKLLVLTGRLNGDRWQGLEMPALERLHRLAQAQGAALLVEADGARQRPLKAHAAWEPPVPAWVDAVVVCAGLAGLGKPLNESVVHRPDLFAALANTLLESSITLADMRRVLLDDAVGGLKNIPPEARRIAFLNQVDTARLAYGASLLAPHLLKGYDRVLVAALQKNTQTLLAVYRPLAGIVLAAGGAARFGQAKQVLPVDGRPAVRRVALAALRAGLHPLRVVTGAYAAEVNEALAGLPVEIIANPAWQTGQSSSLRAGLAGLPPGLGGAVFLPADQPFISAGLLHALRRAHASGEGLVFAPSVKGSRTSPTLFDSALFSALNELQGDSGGRMLFERFPPTLVPWQDARLLLDLDTPADFETALQAERAKKAGQG